jgi:hypothetical protein
LLLRGRVEAGLRHPSPLESVRPAETSGRHFPKRPGILNHQSSPVSLSLAGGFSPLCFLPKTEKSAVKNSVLPPNRDGL